jgi:hypothetical protein
MFLSFYFRGNNLRYSLLGGDVDLIVGVNMAETKTVASAGN